MTPPARSRSRRRHRRWTRFALALGLALLVASPAAASYETLKRSLSALLMTPLDLVTGPYVGVKAVIDNVRDVEDTTGVRVAYFLPGLGWNMGMQAGGACLRTIAGALELVPGIFLVPFEADLEPLYPLAGRQDALVDRDYRFLNVKFGINYVD